MVYTGIQLEFFATEYDGEDTFFGLVDGHERELGYFSLAELKKIREPLGLPVDRDLYWKSKAFKKFAPEMFLESLGNGSGGVLVVTAFRS